MTIEVLRGHARFATGFKKIVPIHVHTSIVLESTDFIPVFILVRDRNVMIVCSTILVRLAVLSHGLIATAKADRITYLYEVSSGLG